MVFVFHTPIFISTSTDSSFFKVNCFRMEAVLPFYKKSYETRAVNCDFLSENE